MLLTEMKPVGIAKKTHFVPAIVSSHWQLFVCHFFCFAFFFQTCNRSPSWLYGFQWNEFYLTTCLSPALLFSWSLAFLWVGLPPSLSFLHVLGSTFVGAHVCDLNCVVSMTDGPRTSRPLARRFLLPSFCPWITTMKDQHDGPGSARLWGFTRAMKRPICTSTWHVPDQSHRWMT